jgi:hypothetical protein
MAEALYKQAKGILSLEMIDVILCHIGAVVAERAINMAPVDTGELRSKIKYKKVGSNVVKIYADVPYADDLEYGRPPEPLNEDEKEGLRKWAERHGVKNPDGTVRYIEKHGLEVGTVDKPLHVTWLGRDSYRPFLRPALYQSIPYIREAIIADVKRGKAPPCSFTG